MYTGNVSHFTHRGKSGVTAPSGSLFLSLTKLGQLLDQDEYPRILVGGRLQLGNATDPSYSMPGMGVKNGVQGTGRSSPGRGQGSAGREGTADGSWSPISKAQVVSWATLGDRWGRDIAEGVVGAYPQAQFRLTPDAIWMKCRVSPIGGRKEEAVLVVRHPREPSEVTSGWAWSPHGIWIGPRHCNYGDGSICAFEMSDGTWTREMGLAPLLDLSVLWVARQRHLEQLGRWPGRQVLHTAFERLRDHRPGEFCGCDSGQPYEACCRTRDERVPAHERTRSFMQKFSNSKRHPPAGIGQVMAGRIVLPTGAEIKAAVEA